MSLVKPPSIPNSGVCPLLIPVPPDAHLEVRCKQGYVSKCAHGLRALCVQNGRAQAYVDSALAMDVQLAVSVPANGFVALGTPNWGIAYFDNLLITSA